MTFWDTTEFSIASVRFSYEISQTGVTRCVFRPKTFFFTVNFDQIKRTYVCPMLQTSTHFSFLLAVLEKDDVGHVMTRYTSLPWWEDESRFGFFCANYSVHFFRTSEKECIVCALRQRFAVKIYFLKLFTTFNQNYFI